MYLSAIYSSLIALFFIRIPPPPLSTLFPYTTLFRSRRLLASWDFLVAFAAFLAAAAVAPVWISNAMVKDFYAAGIEVLDHRDRKSTRLNSSHPSISYAVFCLKKKKTDQTTSVGYMTV